jgi:hypothetical protein
MEKMMLGADDVKEGAISVASSSSSTVCTTCCLLR